jgi:diacylglycerol kinase family enzyme
MTMGRFRPFSCRLSFDDAADIDRRALMVVVNNGRYFGAGMHVAPTASMTDGRFDVLVLKEAGLLELLMAFPKIYSGTHVTLPIVDVLNARHVRISGESPQLVELDGEQPGITPATFEVVPGALQVLV